jgi:hypothetical protein
MSAVKANLVFFLFKKEHKKYLDKIQWLRLTKSDSNPFNKASFIGNTSQHYRLWSMFACVASREDKHFQIKILSSSVLWKRPICVAFTSSQARAMSKSCTALVRILLSMPATWKVVGDNYKMSSEQVPCGN